MKRRQAKTSNPAQTLDDAKLDRVGGGFGAGSEWGWSSQWDEPVLAPDWYSESGSETVAHELHHAVQSRSWSDSW